GRRGGQAFSPREQRRLLPTAPGPDDGEDRARGIRVRGGEGDADQIAEATAHVSDDRLPLFGRERGGRERGRPVEQRHVRRRAHGHPIPREISSAAVRTSGLKRSVASSSKRVIGPHTLIDPTTDASRPNTGAATLPAPSWRSPRETATPSRRTAAS